ncbi:hypothetical protein SAMN05216228_1010159 [Rhizobium tibeticum]|uniref:Uncharacterized protein n=2 Tax=Rhizobium tibeticum TaxID=501024 RepID=A0A1H8L8K8_9HYPH|nr:hypothetical protein RTCCBAU85039_2800 [Rhizobium tibeticum]SEO01409.1 hypothetical protein SAMN05216228_1010159 [Rhizobium tibeticum]
MSSHPLSIVTSADVAMLQIILDTAGYDAASSLADPKRYNVAAKLLIRRFQEGGASSRALSQELDRHFGTSLSKEPLESFSRTRASIQGLRVSPS